MIFLIVKSDPSEICYDRSSIISSKKDCSESACLLQNEQQSSHIKKSPMKPPHVVEKLSSSPSHTSMLNTSFLQSVILDTDSLSVDLLDQDSPLSSVSLTCANMQFDQHSAKQDQTVASCSDYVTTNREESNISSHPRTDVTPNVEIMKSK